MDDPLILSFIRMHVWYVCLNVVFYTYNYYCFLLLYYVITKSNNYVIPSEFTGKIGLGVLFLMLAEESIM